MSDKDLPRTDENAPASAAPADSAPDIHQAGPEPEPFDVSAAVFPRSKPEEADEGSRQTVEQNLAVVMGVPVKMQVVLGAATMPVASLLKLGRGAIVELDHKVGEPVEVTINDRVIARGEVVVVDEDRFGVTLTDIVADPFSGVTGKH